MSATVMFPSSCGAWVGGGGDGEEGKPFSQPRADVTLRRGDMTAARREGLAALGLLPRSAWGIGVGYVLLNVVLAATELGDWQTADSCLVEMPDAMYDTIYGAQYLYPLGLRLLAADRLRSTR